MFNTIPDNVNPIFSQAKDPDFNENMDEYVKAPNDIYIEEQKKAAFKIKRNVNAEALDNIPEMPDFLYEQYQEMNKLPDIYNRLNVVSQQEIRDWEKQEKMGIAETWSKKRKWEMVPFTGTTAETTLAIRNANTLRKIKKGEQVSDTDLDLLVEQLRDMKELEVRGRTLGGAALDTLMTCIPYALEFGASLATLPEGAGGAGFAKMLATAGSKKAARKAVEAAVKEAAVESTRTGVKKTVSLSAAKSIYKTAQNDFLKQEVTKAAVKGMGEVGALKTAGLAMKATPGALAKAVRINMTRMPQHFIGSVADRQLSSGVYVTDTGDSIFTQSENLATSIMKSFADTTIDAWTESMGWGLGGVTSYFAKPLRKLLPKTFFTGFEKLVSSRYGMPAAEALRKYGYDGVIEEMGEEQLSRLLCQVFFVNSDNLSDYFNFDSFMNNVFYFDRQGKEGIEGLKAGLKSAAEGYGTEALSFAAMSGGGHVAGGAISKGVEQWGKNKTNKQIKELTDKANQRLYSPEQFYLDQGFIKIKGSQSLAEQKLREIWTKENVPEGLQNSVLQSMSQYEVQDTLKKAVENDREKTTDKEKQKQDIEEIFYKKATAAGVSDEQADALSRAVSFFAQKYVPEGMDPKEWISKLNIKKNIPADKILQGGIEYNDNPNYEIIENKLNQIYEQYDKLPDDFDDEQTINQYLDEMQILEDVQNGNISQDNIIQAQNLIQEYKESEPELANALENAMTKTHFQSAAMKRSQFDDFKDFYDDVLAKPKNTTDKRQFNAETKDGLNLRIPHDTILHERKRHKLTTDEWQDLLDNIDDVSTAVKSRQKSRFNGKPVLLKINTPNNTYGVVIEAFEKNNPLIATAFTDTEQNIDNWIKKEAIPSGTKTSFLGNRLNNIITSVQPKFKPFNPNVKNGEGNTYFQSAQTAGANENETAIAKKEWQEKGTDSRFFKKWFGNSKVVDENGEPLVVYHNTNNKFDTFDKTFIGSATDDGLWGRGFYFGNSVNDSYGKKAMSMYFKMENPFRLNDFKTVKEIADYLDVDESNFRIGYDGLIYFSQGQVRQITSHIQDRGHDGVIVRFPSGYTEYVAFSPEQIKSVDNQGTFDSSNPNIYYQSVNNEEINSNVVDLTNDFEKTPSLEDVKKYINQLIQEGVKFATSSPGWFVDVKGDNRTKGKILNRGNYKKLNKTQKGRHNKYVMSLEKLLSNAVHTGEKENTKKDKKPNVEKYHYFKTNAKIGDKIYEIIFDTEEYKNDNPQGVDYAKRNSKEHPADNNSITDNREKVNPKTVHLYNITELKQGTHYQGESYDDLVQKHNDKLEKQKEEYKGYFTERLNVITLMNNADASTLPHELAHFFLTSYLQ